MARKHGEVEEIAAMEAAGAGGARTSGIRVPAVPAAAESKLRKLEASGRGGFQISLSYMQLRSCRIVIQNIVSERKNSLGLGLQNPSSSDELGFSSSSCCSSNRSSEIRNERNEFVGLEEDCCSEAETSTFSCCSESETTPFIKLREESEDLMDSVEKSFDGVNSTTKGSNEQRHCRCRLPTAERMPTDAELEDFFSAAEKQLQDKFTDKYNFDFEKEKPLEGSYEWVKLRQ